MKYLVLIAALLLPVAAMPQTESDPSPYFSKGGYWNCHAWNFMSQSEQTSYVMGYREGIAAVMGLSAFSDGKFDMTAFRRRMSLMTPKTLNNGETAGRISTYCTAHETDEVGTAMYAVTQSVNRDDQ